MTIIYRRKDNYNNSFRSVVGLINHNEEYTLFFNTTYDRSINYAVISLFIRSKCNIYINITRLIYGVIEGFALYCRRRRFRRLFLVFVFFFF